MTVIAPVRAIDYGNPERRLLASRGVPYERRDGALRILHPRWLYPPFGGAANAFFLAARLLPLLRTYRDCDIIDAHWTHPAGVAVALASRSLRRPFMITVRGNEVEHARSPLRRSAMAWALRRADAVICLSGRLREFATGCGVDPGRIRIIPNGVDTSVFHPRGRGARAGTPLVVSAGQLIELKGHHHIVRALRDIKSAHLVIAGGPGRHVRYEAEIRRQVKAADMEGRVRFAGQLPQAALAELMCAADVFCLASSREGWPNVVQEALACGTPVVATDVGAVPEMIPSEDYGYIVPPGDETRLRDALQSALNRSWDRERISAFGQSRSWDLVGRQVLEGTSKALRAQRISKLGDS